MYGFRLAAPLIILALIGCSGGGPFSLPAPSGIITEQVVGQSTVVPATSLTSPLQVHNGFSLLLSEGHYTDIFSATILSFTAPTACYTVAIDQTGKVAVFTPVVGPPPPAPPTCPFPGDVESVRIKDVQNHSTIVFFQNVGP